MKVLSLSVNSEPLEGKFEGSLERKSFLLRQEVNRYVVLTARATHEFSIAGGTYHLISAERKAGSAAAGVIVGGMLAHGTGLLAGGATGGGTTNMLSIHHGDVILVAEFSTEELAQLAAYGVPTDAQAPGVSSVELGELSIPPATKLGWGAVIALLLLFFVFR